MSSIIPKEAQRLLDDATLALAMDEIRLEALNDLANVQADDVTAVLRLQQRVQAIEDIRSKLQSAAATKPISPGGSYA